MAKTARSAREGESGTRERMIDAGVTLFQRQGYHGTGLIQLLQESDSPKGSFYYHFPGGKEELADAAVRSAGDGIIALIDKAFGGAACFSDGARAMGTFVADWFERSGYGEGCPITSVLLETVPGSERLTAACRTVIEEWVERVRTHAERLGECADQAALLSTGLVLAIEGAWIVSRAQRSRQAFEVAVEMVARSAARA